MATAEPVQGQHPGSPFWTFSLKVYRLPGVPAACLTLQDGSGAPVDVNVVLFALFCAAQGRLLAQADLRRIIDHVETWRVGIVVPLRSARRALKEPPSGFDTPAVAALRTRVKAIELEAERLQQESLFAALPAHRLGMSANSHDALPANVTAYAQVLGARFDAKAVRTIVDAVSTLKD